MTETEFINILQIYFTAFGLSLFTGLFLWIIILGSDTIHVRGRNISK